MGHPILSLMKTTMENLKSMVDVNTVVGEAVETKDGTVIMPVSRMSFGFVTGGGDEIMSGQGAEEEDDDSSQKNVPFTGGSGAGVTVRPVGFLVVSAKRVRFLPVDDGAILDRVLDEAPILLSRIKDMVSKDEVWVKERSE